MQLFRVWMLGAVLGMYAPAAVAQAAVGQAAVGQGLPAPEAADTGAPLAGLVPQLLPTPPPPAPPTPPPTPPPCDSILVKFIVLAGNDITKRHILLRELDYAEGQKIAVADTSKLFRVGRNRIFNTRLFVTVSHRVHLLELQDGPCPQPVLVEIRVKERWYIFPFPVLELADRSINEWIYNQGASLRRINYGLRVEANNLRGRNETLKMIAQTGFTRKLEASYSIPYLTKRLKEGLVLGAQYLSNKQVSVQSLANRQDFIKDLSGGPLFRRLNTRAAFVYRPQYWITHQVGLEYWWLAVADSVARYAPNFMLDGRSRQRYFYASYTFTYDRRDIRQYPLKGFFFSAKLERLGLRPQDDVQLWSSTLDLSNHTPLGGRWFLGQGVAGTISTPWRQPYAQSRFLGFGQNFVRGYERYVMESPLNIVVKNTVRYRLYRKTIQVEDMPLPQFSTLPFAIYLKMYADGGYARNPLAAGANARLLNTWLGGAGVGLDLVTYYDYVIRFEYSLNRQGERGLFFHVAVEL